jgi:thiamine biosynthesis lipoprotein ApbE
MRPPPSAETLEILSDSDFVQDMSDGLEDIAAGNVVSLVEFKRIVDKLNQ